MKDEFTASRMRRELDREYDLRVFNPGRLVLSIRLPLEELSHISGADTLAVHDKLLSRDEKIRPEDVEDIFIISDNDHVVVDPTSFFGSIYDEVNVLITPYEEEKEEAEALIIADQIEVMNIEINDEIEECNDEDIQVHLIPTEYKPCVESGPRRVHKKAPVLVKKTNDTSNNNNDITVVTQSPETVSQTVLNDNKLIEAQQPEEKEEEHQMEPDTGVSPNPEKEEEKDKVEVEVETVSLKTTANGEKDSFEDEKIVSKILTDFARNKQKKKVVTGRLKSGRRAEVLTKSKRGRYVRYRMPGEKITDIAIAPTIRAAAHRAVDGKIVVRKSDIREKIRRRRISTLINIVFDTSGSMDETEKISITTDVVLALLKDAYQRRDRVSLVTYSGRSAELVLPFTSSVEAAKRYLEMVPFGGTTPMASGMLTGLETLLQEVKREPAAVPIMILVTDGTANVPMHLGGNIKRELMQVCKRVADLKVNMLVVDISKSGSVLAEGLAEVAGGRYYHPVLLSKETLYSAIKEERDDLTDIASSASS